MRTHSDSEPPAKRDLQREETRSRVYESALEIFRRDGVVEARIDDIARLAGVSRGTFYFHFATKELVLAERLRVGERKIIAMLSSLPQKTRLIAVLDRVAAAMAEEWQADPKIFPEVGMVAVRITAARVPGDETDTVRAALTGHVANAMERDEINPMLPADVVSDIFLVNIFAAALSWCGNPVLPLRDVLQHVVQLFLHGVANKPKK